MIWLCAEIVITGMVALLCGFVLIGSGLRRSVLTVLAAGLAMGIMYFIIHLVIRMDAGPYWWMMISMGVFVISTAAGTADRSRYGIALVMLLEGAVYLSLWNISALLDELIGKSPETLAVYLAVASALALIILGSIRKFGPDPEGLKGLGGNKNNGVGRGPSAAALLPAAGLTAFAAFSVHLLPSLKGTAGIVMLAFSWIAIVCFMVWLKTIAAYNVRNDEMDMNREYMEEMQTFLKTMRSQRHDFNFHVHVLDGLMKRGEYQKCREYLESLCVDTEAVNSLIPISDMAIAALINNYREMCLKKRIPLELDIEDNMSGIVCTVYEANKIIGNLLQNAYDEASLQPGGSTAYGIRLNIFKRSGMTTIRISNKVTDVSKIVEICEFGHSGKSGHDGIGLNNIMQIVDRHGGVFYWEIKEKNIINFIVKIPNRVE